jgi:DNA-binding GntR family transcriptional regulator
VETAAGSVTKEGLGAGALPVAILESVPLNRYSPMPLYFQVAQGLERAITGGTLPPGARLENEIDLAARLGVSRPTMRRAIEQLVAEGLLERIRGIGTRVLDPAARPSRELPGLWDDLQAAGRAPRTQVLEFGVEPADRTAAAALGVKPGARVYVFTRLRLAGSEPLALLRNVVPAGVVRLSRRSLTDSGLYALLRAGGAGPVTCRRTIGARAAKGAEARALGESKGAPVLTVEQTGYDARGVALEYGDHVFRAARYSVDVTTRS